MTGLQRCNMSWGWFSFAQFQLAVTFGGQWPPVRVPKRTFAAAIAVHSEKLGDRSSSRCFGRGVHGKSVLHHCNHSTTASAPKRFEFFWRCFPRGYFVLACLYSESYQSLQLLDELCVNVFLFHRKSSAPVTQALRSASHPVACPSQSHSKHSSYLH
jgi:hypothetical protein